MYMERNACTCTLDVDGTQRHCIPPSRLNSDGRDGNLYVVHGLLH